MIFTQTNTQLKRGLRALALMGVALMAIFALSPVFASGVHDIGAVADSVTNTFGKLAKLITATSYIAGLGFAIGAVLKFKQHKDNPTQIPIGTPVALLFVASALLFLPSILETAGGTLFGSHAKIAGVKGIAEIGGMDTGVGAG